jgi:hypothetical protein
MKVENLDNSKITNLENINLQNIFQNFLNTVNAEIQDLRSLEIITASADDLFIEIKNQNNDQSTNLLKELEKFKNEQKIQILARTHYELDGDIVNFLPIVKNSNSSNSSDLKINSEIMNIHNQTVEKAVKNQQDFIKVMTDFISQIFMGFADSNNLKGIDTFLNIFVPAKKEI